MQQQMHYGCTHTFTQSQAPPISVYKNGQNYQKKSEIIVVVVHIDTYCYYAAAHDHKHIIS